MVVTVDFLVRRFSFEVAESPLANGIQREETSALVKFLDQRCPASDPLVELAFDQKLKPSNFASGNSVVISSSAESCSGCETV